MALPILSLGTSHISKTERVRFWAEALSGLCGKLAADAYGAESIDGDIAYSTIGELKLCRIDASRHRVGLPKEWAKDDAHPVMKVILQTEGSSIFEQDGQRISIEPGDGLVYDVARPHTIYSPGRTQHLVVIIPRRLVKQRGIQLNTMAAKRFSGKRGLGKLTCDFISSTFNQMSSISQDNESELAASLFNIALLPVAEEEGAPLLMSSCAVLANDVKRYIRRHLRDPDLSIDRIATAMDCTKRYLHMAFAADGLTIYKYIWKMRLEECRRELEGSHPDTISLTELAFSWGFKSSSHFSRLFRQAFGSPPSLLMRKKH